MASELFPLSYELSERGLLTLYNVSKENIQILSIEIWFISRVNRLYVLEEKSYIRRIRDIVKVNREIPPGSSIDIDLGVARRNIIEIKVHYSHLNKFDILHIIV